MDGWRVLEAGTTTSDHMPIEFVLRKGILAPTTAHLMKQGWRWVESKKKELTEKMERRLGDFRPTVLELRRQTQLRRI
jgi:hypothetical protein